MVRRRRKSAGDSNKLLSLKPMRHAQSKSENVSFDANKTSIKGNILTIKQTTSGSRSG